MDTNSMIVISDQTVGRWFAMWTGLLISAVLIRLGWEAGGLLWKMIWGVQ